MNDLQVGAVVRAVRRRRGLRQRDVAGLSGASQQLVSLVELGRLEEVGLQAARRVLMVLGIQLVLEHAIGVPRLIAFLTRLTPPSSKRWSAA